jgi:sigma-B regulation protein RsbU (phosphoserine phosphatase)
VANELSEDLHDLYENAPCGYLAVRPDGRIFKANITFATWVGRRPEELLGKRLPELLDVAGGIFYETHFAPLLSLQGFFNEVALDLVTRDDKRLPVLVNAAEKRDVEGRHVFTRFTIFNATERRRYERELLEAGATAEETKKNVEELRAGVQAGMVDERAASALREQFIAVLGHDLRNPLSAISNGMHVLRRTPLNDTAKTTVTMVQRSVSRMAGLIDNVMDFARGRLGGGLSLERNAAEPIESVLRQVVAELQTGVPDKKIESRFTLTAPVSCDRRRIGQLVSNLVGNALTYGASDRPVLVAATTADGWFSLSVANAGDPIPAVVLESIFQPFARGADRPSRQGLGLGLYIAHEIAKAHSGTLEVVSTQTETRFTFRMPMDA